MSELPSLSLRLWRIWLSGSGIDKLKAVKLITCWSDPQLIFNVKWKMCEYIMLRADQQSRRYGGGGVLCCGCFRGGCRKMVGLLAPNIYIWPIFYIMTSPFMPALLNLLYGMYIKRLFVLLSTKI